MADNLKILITASLNVGKSIGELNTQIKALEKRVNAIKLNIQIDDKISKTLADLGRAMENHKKIAQDLNRVIKEEKTVTKEADGTIKEKIRQHLKSGEIIDKEIKKINQQTQATKQQTEETRKLIVERDKLANKIKEITKLDSQGKYAGGSITTGSKYNNTTVNYNANNEVTSQRTVQNIKQQEQAVEKLRQSLKTLYDQGKVNEQFFNNFNKVINSAKNVKEIEKVQNALKRVTDNANNKSLQQKLIVDAQTLLRTHAKTIDQNATKQLINDLKQIKPNAQTAANQLKQLENALKGIKNEAKDAQKSSMTMLEAFKTALVKYPVWLGATSIFIGIPRLVNNAIETIVELDSKLVSLQKVMSEDTNFDQLMTKASDSAREFAKTLSETMDAYIEFSRQGYSEEEIPLLADAALITSNVGEMQSGQAAQYLTSALIQMKLEAKDAMSVIDSWNSISNQNATTVEKLAQGYSRAASVARTWNLDMHELNAIIGTVTAATKQSGKCNLAPYISDGIRKPRICWKLLKLTVPKCDNLLDVQWTISRAG